MSFLAVLYLETFNLGMDKLCVNKLKWGCDSSDHEDVGVMDKLLCC